MKQTCDFCGKQIPCPMFYDGKMCCPACWDVIRKGINDKEKEATTMKVEYNSFTGELVKLEKKVIDPKSLYIDSIPIKFSDKYELQIFTPENGGVVAFTGVNLKDVKILGGAVSFDV